MERPRHELREELIIRKLVTFYYREMTKHFYTSGESHDFWEFVYVDKGEMEVVTGSGRHVLSQGDMIFYKPNQFHGGKALNGKAPNLIIMSFDCASPCMRIFADRLLRLQEDDLQLLSRIVQEGIQAFDPAIDSPHIAGCPHGREGAPFGGEQLIRNYLEILLIQLIRKLHHGRNDKKPASLSAEKEGNDLVSAIVGHLKDNVAGRFTFDQLCEQFAVSRTRLKTLFRAKTGSGVMEYFNRLKIERSKLLMREEQANLSAVAERLGYSSVQYFSKQFKRITDMSPSEYIRSVKARSGLAGSRSETATEHGSGERD